MKKMLLISLISIVAIINFSAVFANNKTTSHNVCIRNIEDYRFTFFLDLGDCRIQDNDISSILSYLSENSSISVLLLQENNIGPEGAKKLAKELIVDYLIMDDNHIGAEGAKALVQNKSFYALSISENYIGTEGALALATSDSIVKLDVSNNDIKPQGIIALANNPMLRSLGVAENELDAASINALINNKNLVELDVSYTSLSFKDLVALLNRPKIVSLGIKGLGLDDSITTILAQHNSLNYLYIADNQITSVGAKILAKLLHQDFIDLDISHNPIGDQGISAIAKANSRFLPFLSVEDDDIHDEGAIALSQTPLFIIDLNISHNHITSKGIKALKDNPNIEYIDASYNDDDDLVSKEKLTKLRSLCISNMKFSCFKKLQKWMRISPQLKHGI